MLFTWLKNRRRHKLLAEPFPDAWLEWLQENVRLYAQLPQDQQAKLRDLVKVFVAEKNWEGCRGFVLQDEMRVTIAAQACLLLLGNEADYYFDGVRTILVYPNAYLLPQQTFAGSVVVEEREEPVLGSEHHYHDVIILSWPHVLEGGRNPHNGHNLVLHEFAHHLDGLDGAIDGVPQLASAEQYRQWRRVTDAEHRRLMHMSRRGERTLLDWYGATDPAEFFAVATECFFEQPQAMLQRHPELYDALRGFYRQDPAQWAEPAPARSP